MTEELALSRGDIVFSGELDEQNDIEIEFPDESRYVYISKCEAILLRDHLTAVLFPELMGDKKLSVRTCPGCKAQVYSDGECECGYYDLNAKRSLIRIGLSESIEWVLSDEKFFEEAGIPYRSEDYWYMISEYFTHE